MKNLDKLALVCHHLLENPKQKSFLVLEEEPTDESDSGKIYTCRKCAENEPHSQEEFMDMLTTCCLHCLFKKKI